MADSRERVTVNRVTLLKNIAYLRTLFRTLGFDVRRYTDETVVDALLSVSAVLDDTWPTDEQIQEAFDRLRSDRS